MQATEKPYVYQEYPKALYREGAYLAVASVEEEDAARAEGYDDWAADQATHGEVEQEVQTSAEPDPSTPPKPAAAPKAPKKAKDE